MKALVKWLGIAIGVVVVLIAGVLIYLAFFFDADAYKGRIIDYMAAHYQRTLTIDGKLSLSVFPRIAIAIPHTTLSEPRGPAIAAEVKDIRVSLELLPLLRKEIRVGEIALDGLRTSFVRDRNGRSNFDDFLQSGAKKDETKPAQAPDSAPGSTVVSFDVGGVRISDSAITYRDLKAGQDIAISRLELKIGRLADKTLVPLDLSVRLDGKQPAVAGTLSASGKVLLDLGAPRYAADDFTAKFDGQFEAQPLTASIDLPKLDWAPDKFAASTLKISVKRGGAQSLDATLALEGASGTPKSIEAKQLSLDAQMAGGGRTINANLKTPLAANLDALALTLAAIDGRVQIDDPAMPVKKVDMPFKASLSADAKAEKISGRLDTKFDESTISAQFNVAGFAKPAIGIDLGIDRISLDRYLKSTAPAAPDAGAAPTAAAPAKEEPFDLSALKALTLDGAARVGELQVHGLKLSKLALKLAAKGGDVRLAPLTAQLYGGAIDASARVDANADRFALASKLTSIQIGPLLKDGAKIDKLEGRGNVALDVVSVGNTVTALKRALGGNASVKLADGAIVGFDYAKRLSDWKTKLSSLGGGAKTEASNSAATEKTDFSEFSASFAIANGVATNNDLMVKAPLVRLAGAGSIDVGHDSLDYTVKASVVNTLTGQGGKDLAQTRDITIPVRVHGPYDKMAYEIQWGAVSSALLKGAVSQKVDAQKKQLEDKARNQLQDKLKGLFR